MRVSGVNNLITYNPAQNLDIQVSKIQGLRTGIKDSFEKGETPIAFTALITSGSEFKAITKKHPIRCPYCNCYMLYEGTLNRMLKSGKFNGSLNQFLETAMPYKKYLKPWRRKFLKTLKRYAKKHPKKTLSDAVKDMYPESVQRLVRKQAKVLRELNRTSKNILPIEIEQKFDKFMRIQHNRLYEIPYIEEFRGKVFTYKLGKMLQTVNESKTKKYLLQISKPLSSPIFKDLSNEIPEIIIKSIAKKEPLPDRTAKGVIAFVLNRIKTIAEKEKLADIVQLCETSEKMLNAQPVIIKFSNKEFVYELRTHLLAGYCRTPIGKKILDIAKKLPSSNGNKDSFIAKHKDSNSNTIAFKFLEPSIATIEHIKPRSLNGMNKLNNMALACRADNNNRGSLPLNRFLNWWSRRKPQHYFNDLIRLNNKENFFDPETIQDMARSFEDEGTPKINLRRMRQQS